MRNVSQDTDRHLRKWYRELRPGSVIREVVTSNNIALIYIPNTASGGYCIRRNAILVSDKYDLVRESEQICTKWVAYRIHKRIGRAPQRSENCLIQEWVEEYFLPRKKLQEHPHYQSIHWEFIRRSGLDIRSSIEELATHFFCTPDLVISALCRRGYLDKNGALMKNRNIIALPLGESA